MLMNRGSLVRALRIGAAVSLLGVIGCADVDASLDEEAALAQEATAESHPDLGKGPGNDVITLGDSWMSNTLQILGTGGGIAASLTSPLGPTKLSYRNYAVQGVEILKANGFGPAVPTQWDAASRVNKNIKTVIMTAGGNDVLQAPGAQADCLRGGERCKATLKKIGDALDELWKKMGAAGVQDVVYIGYAEAAGGAGPDATNTTKNGVSEVCKAQTTIRCHAIDSTPYVTKANLTDGIHPNKATNDKLAKVIYEYLEQNGIRR